MSQKLNVQKAECPIKLNVQKAERPVAECPKAECPRAERLSVWVMSHHCELVLHSIPKTDMWSNDVDDNTDDDEGD